MSKMVAPWLTFVCVVLSILSMLVGYSPANAAPKTRAACTAIPADLFSTTNSKGTAIMCATVAGKLSSGKVKGLCFNSDNDATKAAKKKWTKSKRASDKKNFTNKKKLATVNNALCKTALDGGDSPVPTPGPIVTPTPIPTENPFSCFTNASATKPGCFGIPSGVTGSITTGAALWSSKGCAGCHIVTDNLNKSYSTLTAVLPISPMFITSTVQERADLTAFSNRFQQ